VSVPTPRDLLNAAKAEIHEIDPHDVAARLSYYNLLDVREPEEFDQGALPGAVHIPRGNLEFSIESRLTDKNAPIAVYCAGGVRSAFAAKTLQDLGYTDVVSIIGGFNKWKDEGLVWSTHAER
jgi:rhodanese-related sulfurtransferase